MAACAIATQSTPGRNAIRTDVLEVAHFAESAVAAQVIPTGWRRPGRARGILHDILRRVPVVWEARPLVNRGLPRSRKPGITLLLDLQGEG